MKKTFEEVCQIVNGEREYQDKRWNDNTTSSGGKHDILSWATFMQHYLNESIRIVSTTADPEATQEGLAMILKLTGLGVACLEQYGFERSDIYRDLSFSRVVYYRDILPVEFSGQLICIEDNFKHLKASLLKLVRDSTSYRQQGQACESRLLFEKGNLYENMKDFGSVSV